MHEWNTTSSKNSFQKDGLHELEVEKEEFSD